MKCTVNRILFTACLVIPVYGNAEDLVDPTRPAEYQTTLVVQDLPRELVDWRVTAIRLSETDRSAIVNGKIVRVGDSVSVGDNIGQATILEIQNLQVILEYENKRIAVRLFRDALVRKELSNREADKK